jgi:Flp pilus assembly protein TadG
MRGANRTNRGRKGSEILEFTLTSIPLIFLLTGTFQVGIGMWGYHSLAEGVKTAARLAAVRGPGCAGKSCATTVGTYVSIMLGSGVPGNANVTFTAAGATYTCNPLTSCSGSSSVWPSLSSTTLGSDVVVTATYQFRTLLPMVTMGGSASIGSQTFGAKSRQMVVF